MSWCVSKSCWQPMRLSPARIGLAAATVGGLAYPFFVYLTHASLPPLVFAAIGAGLIALRGFGLRALLGWIPAIACLIGAALLAAIASFAPDTAAKAYPVAVSLIVAGTFAASLIYPPSFVERIARLREPDLPADGVRYTRRVTQVWVAVLLLNAGVCAATALWASLDIWTLWTGLLSYGFLGTVFGIEYLIRRQVKRAAAPAA